MVNSRAGWDLLNVHPVRSLPELGVDLQEVRTVCLSTGRRGVFYVETWDAEHPAGTHTVGLLVDYQLPEIVAALARPGRKLRVVQLPDDAMDRIPVVATSTVATTGRRPR